MKKNVVVVTGAASGMGMAAARRLARPDRTLLLVDTDNDRLAAARENLAETAGSDIAVVQANVSDANAIADLAEIVSSSGRFEILAHAAGISPTMADWRTVVRVDLVGTAIVLDAFLPLAESGSVAVCWSSSAAYMGAPARGDAAIDALLDEPRAPDLLERLDEINGEHFQTAEGVGAAYGWAKRGVNRLVERRAAAWSKQGARILAVSPGIIDTPMSRFEYATRPYMQKMVENTPVSRMGTASEVAELVAFLVSPEASFITGTDILIDGGFAATLAAL